MQALALLVQLAEAPGRLSVSAEHEASQKCEQFRPTRLDITTASKLPAGRLFESGAEYPRYLRGIACGSSGRALTSLGLLRHFFDSAPVRLPALSAQEAPFAGRVLL